MGGALCAGAFDAKQHAVKVQQLCEYAVKSKFTCIGITHSEDRVFFQGERGVFSFPIASIGHQTVAKLVSNNHTEKNVKPVGFPMPPLKPLQVPARI